MKNIIFLFLTVLCFSLALSENIYSFIAVQNIHQTKENNYNSINQKFIEIIDKNKARTDITPNLKNENNQIPIQSLISGFELIENYILYSNDSFKIPEQNILDFLITVKEMDISGKLFIELFNIYFGDCKTIEGISKNCKLAYITANTIFEKYKETNSNDLPGSDLFNDNTESEKNMDIIKKEDDIIFLKSTYLVIQYLKLNIFFL